MLFLVTFLKARFSRKLNVFLVCLIISVIIWLLISLSKNYSTEVEFPVEHYGFPQDRVLIDPLPQKLTLEVNSHGFELLTYKLFSRKDPVQVDMGKLRYRDRGERRKAYLPTRELLDRLSQQFPDNTRIEDVDPDTLFVSMAPREKKKVKVLPELNVEFREQYRMAEEVEVTPSKVELSGPSTILDTTHTVRTNPLVLKDLHENQEEEVGLLTDSISEKVEAEPSKVRLRIRVNEFTEGKARVPLQYENVPDQFTLKTYPDSVTVHYLVGFENYEKVEREMFEAYVPFPEGQSRKEQERIDIELKDHPSFIDILRLEPERVEFIIRKEE